MSSPAKITITIGILLVAFFVVGNFFLFDTKDGFVKNFKIDSQGKPIGTTLPKEEGRTVTDHGQNVPREFPLDIPIETNPIKVFKSFTETAPGDISERENRHVQTTFSYLSQKSAKEIEADFEEYFKNLEFSVTKNNYGSLSTLYAQKGSDVTGTITITSENSFERLVTISLISVERLQTK